MIINDLLDTFAVTWNTDGAKALYYMGGLKEGNSS